MSPGTRAGDSSSGAVLEAGLDGGDLLPVEGRDAHFALAQPRLGKHSSLSPRRRKPCPMNLNEAGGNVCRKAGLPCIPQPPSGLGFASVTAPRVEDQNGVLQPRAPNEDGGFGDEGRR